MGLTPVWPHIPHAISSGGRMRADLIRRSAVAIAVVASACGGSSPSAPSATQSGIAGLRAGEYIVTLSAATAPGSACFGISTNGQTPDTVAFTGTITGDGTTFTLRPTGAADRGLVVTFRSAGSASITGPASGQVRDDTSDIVASIAPTPANAATGAPATEASFFGSNAGATDPRVFTGSVTGALSWSGQGGSTVCAVGAWAMRPK